MNIRSLILVGILAATTAIAEAAETCHLYIRAANQGQIKGTKALQGREGWIEVIAIQSPRDPASGQATGRRQYKPFVVQMPVGQAGQQLLQALCTNENITEFKLSMKDEAGKVVVGTLTGVRIQKITFERAKGGEVAMEEISFVFQKITW